MNILVTRVKYVFDRARLDTCDCTRQASLSGTFLQTKDVENQCLECAVTVVWTNVALRTGNKRNVTWYIAAAAGCGQVSRKTMTQPSWIRSR